MPERGEKGEERGAKEGRTRALPVMDNRPAQKAVPPPQQPVAYPNLGQVIADEFPVRAEVLQVFDLEFRGEGHRVSGSCCM